MRDDSYKWLGELKMILWNNEFISKNRNEEERNEFYKNI
jgi:hypothetical protein